MEGPPDELALYVENPDGTERRLAGDEPSLPLSDYTASSTLPGGFDTLDGESTLSHGIDAFRKLGAVTARLPDRTIAWQGRISATPETSDDRTLTLACVGHQAALVDAQGIVFCGVDSDLTAWEEPPRDYRKQQADSSISTNSVFQVSAAEEGLTISMTADKSVTASSRGEMWNTAPAGQKWAQVQWIGSEVAETNMDTTLRTKDTPTGSTLASSNMVLDLSMNRWTPSAPGSYVVFRDSPSTTVNKAARVATAHAISLFGDHDLPRQEIENLPDGLYFSDILAYLLEQYAPLLMTEVAGESTIEQSSFVLPHASWRESTGLDAIIEDGITFEPGREWAVWEGPTLHYGRRDNMGREWTVYRSKGARFIDSGETSEPDYNLVVVNYSDRDGTPRRAGPPGGGYDIEDAALRDSDPDNPVNASSVVRDRPYIVDIGDSTPEKAVELGQLALEDVLRRRFTGEVELPRYAECEGVVLPTSLIHAGDWVIDASTPNAERLPLVGASYQRSAERPFKGTIDTPANRLDAAIARRDIRPRHIPFHKLRHDRQKRRENRLARRRRIRRRNWWDKHVHFTDHGPHGN